MSACPCICLLVNNLVYFFITAEMRISASGSCVLDRNISLHTRILECLTGNYIVFQITSALYWGVSNSFLGRNRLLLVYVNTRIAAQVTPRLVSPTSFRMYLLFTNNSSSDAAYLKLLAAFVSEP